MYDYNKKHEEILHALRNKCVSFFGKDENGNVVVVDPIDNKVISDHYAMSHTAAALIISGDSGNIKLGIDLLNGMLNRWDVDSKLPGFHNDFNNFALCLVYKELINDGKYSEECHRIKATVLSTADSNHNTINWLPMRIFVNQCRYEWTQNIKYLTSIENINNQIRRAFCEDGFIEDRLPAGLSLNLQYNAATVAGLQFLNKYSEKLNLDKKVVALVNALAPDGDINYLGRGCNQIFAWGPWIYLLKARGQEAYLQLSTDFLYQHIFNTLENNNLMMNTYLGEEKFMWWDYHYSSVYIAHLYLWMQLAWKLQMEPEVEIPQYEEFGNNSGIKIIRTEDCFVCTFQGKSEYLAESGPAIYALWIKGIGFISKGAYGPWMGAFGNKYSNNMVLLNSFTPLVTNRKFELRKYTFNFSVGKNKLTNKIVFPKITVTTNNDCIEIEFKYKKKVQTYFNWAVFDEDTINRLKFFVNNEELILNSVGYIKSQYKYCRLLQSKERKTKSWKILITRNIDND